MRKVLLSILTVLLVVMTALIMKNGIKIGSLQVLGFQGLADESQKLTEKIDEANQKEDSYKSTLSALESDSKSLAQAKKDYLDLVSVSSASDIQQALQTKTYTIEYLWSRVGNHATSEGVTVTMNVVSSSAGAGYRDLEFNASGKYLAISNFIYDLENDTNLEFTIDDFDMKSGVATFKVKGVRIIQENSTATVGGSSKTATNSASNTTTDGNSTTNATTNETSNTTNDGTTNTTENNSTSSN